jgi:YggT family protein
VDFLCPLITLYVLAIIGRILLSYFPIEPGSGMAQVFSVLYTITEPLLGPLRRIVPRVGMLDLSPMVAILILEYVVPRILGC